MLFRSELKPVDAHFAVELLFTQLEAAVLRLTVSQNADFDELSELTRQVLRLLQRKDS